MTPAAAARELRERVAALSPSLHRAAVAWLKPEAELAAALATRNGLTPSRSERVEVNAHHPLAGVPYFLKDLFDLAGVPTRAGSTFLHRVRALPASDSRIARHLTTHGAACAGKTHLVEFASGLTC
jgi:Asp-tRNA(Asn)/Glu-tRNA(Gln) amidotransferase A subunit family amidase